MSEHTCRSLLLISLWLASLSLLIFQPNTITWILGIIIMGLLLWQCSWRLIMTVVVVSLPVGLFLYSQLQELNQKERQQFKQAAVFVGTIMPDSIKIDGQQLQAQARLDNGEKLRLYWTIPSKTLQQEWQEQVKVVNFRASGQCRPIDRATNFSQFDAHDYYRTQGITHQLQVDHWEPVPARPHSIYDVLVFKLREWHAQLLKNANQLPKPLSYYTQALLLGASSDELYGDNPGVQTLGLIHLFSVSGFQVNLLIGVCMAVGRRLGWLYEVTAIVLMLLLPIYFIFSGGPAVLVRAIVAGELGLITRCKHWRLPSVAIWSISLIASLAIAPQILLTLGGQLSFLLTFGLLFTQTLSPLQRNLWLGALTFPLIIATQYSWHILQTLANLIAIPLFEILIVPVVTIGYLGQWWSELRDVCNALLHFFASSIDFCANLPGNIVIGKLPDLILLGMALVGWFLFAQQARLAKWSRYTWVALLGIGCLWVHFPVQGEYTTFDIGQGDSALIREPLNRSVTLIDTGGRVTFKQQPAWQERHYQRSRAETIIIPYLHSCGISTIDQLVLTHQDQDHIGDAAAILSNLRVRRIIVPAGMVEEQIFQQKIKPYLKNTEVIAATNQTVVAGLPLKILHPFQAGKAENENSLALWGALGPQYLFTAGDLDQKGEQAIADQYPGLKVDLLKFGHHGSKTSTSPAVIAAWRPKVGIISAGRNNRYHHPHKETLNTAATNELGIFNTQNNGMIRYVYTKHQAYFEVKIKNESKAATRTN